jgi:hypothetical protein
VLLYYAHNPNGRNNTARTYHNRKSLLSSGLLGVSHAQLGGMIDVLARHVLTGQGRL